MPVFKPIIKGAGGGAEITGQEEVTATYKEIITAGDTLALRTIDSGGQWDTAHTTLAGSKVAVPPTYVSYPVFSSDSIYLGMKGSNNFVCFKRDGDTFTNITTGTNVIPAIGRYSTYGFSMSPDGEFFIIGADSPQSDSGYTGRLYKRDSSDDFTEVTQLYSGSCIKGSAFSDDNIYYATNAYFYWNYGSVKYPDWQYTTRVRLAKRTGDAWSSLNYPPNYETSKASAGGIAWSPDATYLASTSDSSPYIKAWKRVNDTFTSISIPSLPSTNKQGELKFSPNGEYLIVKKSGYAASVYKISSAGVFTLMDASTIPETSSGDHIGWSSDSKYVGVGNNFYKRVGDTFTVVSLPYLSGYAFGVQNKYLVLTGGATPFLHVLETEVNSGSIKIGAYKANNLISNTKPPAINGFGFALESGAKDSEKTIIRLCKET